MVRVATDPVERYGRRTRWLHAGVYLTTLATLATGWWLLAGREGDPTPVARLLGVSDAALHVMTGWALAGLLLLGVRGLRAFLSESVRHDRDDLAWMAAWPKAVFTGRFRYHGGRFDPGQRIMNLTLGGGLLVLVGSGAGMALLHGGPVFAVLSRVHTWSTFMVTVLVAGHVLVASGVLPGYRGVWRSMHLGGRLSRDVARRLWPAWRPKDTL